MGNVTGRNTKAPTTKGKAIKPHRKGEPPSAPQEWGESGEEKNIVGGHIERSEGLFFKFFNFLLLKTFPKKMWFFFSIMSG